MPTIRANVHKTNLNLGPEFNLAVKEALKEAAELGAEESRRVAGERPGQTGDMQNITISDAVGTPLGWQVQVTSHAFWAWFQEFGTLGNRKRKLKQSPRATTRSGRHAPNRDPGTGIEPLRFLSAGLSATRKAFLPALQRKLR